MLYLVLFFAFCVSKKTIYQSRLQKIKLCITLGLGDGREIYILQPERQPNKELKVQNMYKSSSKNFQPGTTDDSSTKADEKHVSPAIAKPTVIGIFRFVQRLKR